MDSEYKTNRIPASVQKRLDDLAEAAKQPINGFIKIETEEDPKQIELDAKQIAAEAPALQEDYGISSLQRLQ
jgi:hypothetical protein